MLVARRGFKLTARVRGVKFTTFPVNMISEYLDALLVLKGLVTTDTNKQFAEQSPNKNVS